MSARFITSDALTALKRMRAESVNCCVTSPPYWGLRDYGVAGQLGLEPTPEEYVSKLVAIFREARRVLRDDGSLWLNLGDCYATGCAGRQDAATIRKIDACSGRRPNADTYPSNDAGGIIQRKVPPGLKPKDLVGIPWRVAFALQADGWYLRSDIIWHKPNPMPESVTDRPTKAHEYLFLLAKSARYFYDHEAIREPLSPISLSQIEYYKRNGERADQLHGLDKSRRDVGGRLDRNGRGSRGAAMSESGRNRRTVWTVSTRPFKGAHFATFPPALIEPCILAGCPPMGTVLDCFAGAGTTGLVAQQHGRNFTGIELNPEYVAMARARLRSVASTERNQPSPRSRVVALKPAREQRFITKAA